MNLGLKQKQKFQEKKLNTKISPWQENKKFQQKELNATISPQEQNEKTEKKLNNKNQKQYTQIEPKNSSTLIENMKKEVQKIALAILVKMRHTI